MGDAHAAGTRITRTRAHHPSRSHPGLRLDLGDSGHAAISSRCRADNEAIAITEGVRYEWRTWGTSARPDAATGTVNLSALKTRLRLLASIVVSSAACVGPAASLPSPSLSSTPISTWVATRSVQSPPAGSALAMPIGYALPSDCRYVGGPPAPQTWPITCPQGLPSNYLAPSLSQQGWTACASAPKTWRKDQS